MPFIDPGDALNQAIADMMEIAREQGPPPWRARILATDHLRVVLLSWPPGYRTVPHVHPWADEIFQVIKGRAFFTIGDDPEREVDRGAFVTAVRGVRHAIRVPDDEPLLLLAAVAPNEDRPDETVEPA